MLKPLIKKDLYSHFISPHFYICSLILYLGCTIQYFIFGRFFVEGFGSSNLNNFFTAIPYIFSLIIPVLILQISNNELEQTFPFTSFKIILSKLISSIIIVTIMIVPLICVPVIVNQFGQVDAGQVCIAFLGIILYSVLTISLCLLLKELIVSKPAFIAVSIIILLGIDSIHLLSQYVQTNDFFSNLFNSISFIWHFDSFSKGILDSRDIIYFLLTGFVFIVIAYVISETKKGKNFISGKNKIISFVFILVIVFSYIDNSRVYKRIDCTKTKQFAVSKYTKNILRQAQQPVKISYYRSKELINRYPEVRDIYDYLKIIAKENKNISLALLDADKDENIEILEKLGIIPQQIEIVNNNKTEYIKVYSAVLIEYLGNQKVLPFVLSTASLEFELDIRFESLIQNKNHSVYILCGNEYEINDYNYLQLILETSDITCYVITKESLEYLQDQLAVDTPLIVLGTNSLTAEQAASIEEFILKGGKAFIATSQYSVDINGDWSISKNKDDNFIPVLENWGIRFDDKIVNDISNVRISFYSPASGNGVQNETTLYEYVNYPQWLSVIPQNNVPQGISMFWASPIKENSNIMPLFYSSPYSWTVKEYDESIQNKTDQIFLSDPFTVEKNWISDPLFTKEQVVLGAKLKGPISGLYNFETNDSPQLVVLPDQYFAMNLLLELASGGVSDFRNLDFILRSVLALNNESELLKLQNSGFKNTDLFKITTDVQFNVAKNISLVIVFIVIPVLFVILSIIVFVLRRVKNEKYRK